MSAIIIGDREFRIGATYEPKNLASQRRKTLLVYRPFATWPFRGPSVQYRNKNTSTEWSSVGAWLKWAGEEVTS